MSKLPQVKPKMLLNALNKQGFIQKRQTGSHIFLRHPDGRITSISVHSKPIPTGTLRAILKQIKLKPENLKQILK
jgi:predicted RNA binding protein YcfA (HicA-like mRNA interferase family)